MRLLALFLTVAFAHFGRCALHAADASVPPNMIVILVDDMRWDDLGCAGHPISKTPHMDRIATEGARFPNAFATTPLCSPSRACLLTGMYAHAHGITDNTERSAQSHKLVTFPQALQKAGYQTCFIGNCFRARRSGNGQNADGRRGVRGSGSAFGEYAQCSAA